MKKSSLHLDQGTDSCAHMRGEEREKEKKRTGKAGCPVEGSQRKWEKSETESTKRDEERWSIKQTAGGIEVDVTVF